MYAYRDSIRSSFSSVSEQQTADERRKRDEKRNPNKDVSADTGGGLFSDEQKQRDIEDAALDGRTSGPGAVNTKAAEGGLNMPLMRRYLGLGGGYAGVEQIENDALNIIGTQSSATIEFTDIEVKDGDPQTVPMRYLPSQNIIQINSVMFPEMSRGYAASFMVEEIYHSYDVDHKDNSVAASSPRFDQDSGDIWGEAQAAADNDSALLDFLSYPIYDNTLSPSRQRAELFACLAVLCSGNKEAFRRTFPKAYEAFNELETSRQSDYPISTDIRTVSGPNAQGRGQLWNDAGAQASVS